MTTPPTRKAKFSAKAPANMKAVAPGQPEDQDILIQIHDGLAVPFRVHNSPDGSVVWQGMNAETFHAILAKTRCL